MDKIVASDREMLDHAWRYFALHAGQRISMFNFFVVVSGLVGAGLGACLQKGGHFYLLGAGLGALLSLVSFVFWKLDQRTSFLVKHAEDAISELEQSFPVTNARLVGNERPKTDAEGSRLWTYGAAFRLVFRVVASIGVLGTILCLVAYAACLK